MGRQHNVSNSQSRRLARSKREHVVDPLAEDTLETSKNDCHAPRRTLDNTHLQLEPGDINQAEEKGRRHHLIPTTNLISQRQQRSHERHDLAHNGTRWLEMGLRGELLCEQQTYLLNTTHDAHRHDNDNQTNNTRINNAHD